MTNKINKMCKTMEKYTQIDLLASEYINFTDSINETELKSKIVENISWIKWSRKFMKVLFPGCTFCIRNTFVKRIKKYWKSEYAHDAFLWRMALCEDALAVYNSPLIAWRKYSQSSNSKEKQNDKYELSSRLR